METADAFLTRPRSRRRAGCSMHRASTIFAAARRILYPYMRVERENASRMRYHWRSRVHRLRMDGIAGVGGFPEAGMAALISGRKQWDETVFEPRSLSLRDGSVLVLREIRADDAEKLQATIRSLSDESRYSRFFSPMRELPASLLERATHPDARTELQLVAVTGSGTQERIVGGTRYVATETPGDCEFAIAIADEWQGRGLARPAARPSPAPTCGSVP